MNISKRLLGKRDLNNKRLPKAIAKETIGKEILA